MIRVFLCLKDTKGQNLCLWCEPNHARRISGAVAVRSDEARHARPMTVQVLLGVTSASEIFTLKDLSS